MDLVTNNTLGTSAKMAPSFVSGFPGVSKIGQTYFIVDLKMERNATVYWMALTVGSDEPTASAIIAAATAASRR
jgi:hypothetical protein